MEKEYYKPIIIKSGAKGDPVTKPFTKAEQSQNLKEAFPGNKRKKGIENPQKPKN